MRKGGGLSRGRSCAVMWVFPQTLPQHCSYAVARKSDRQKKINCYKQLMCNSYSPGKMSHCRMCCHCHFISCILGVCTKTKSHIAHVVCLDTMLSHCDATIFMLLSYVLQKYQNFEFYNDFIKYQLSQVAKKFS